MSKSDTTPAEENYRMSNAELAQAIHDTNNQRAGAWAPTASIFQDHLIHLLVEQRRRAAERKTND